jgi:uncharacterized protein
VNCPKDNTPLATVQVRGIEVDRCPTCKGMWLDYQELDQLEDTVYTADDLKGTLIFSETPTAYPCPRCGAILNQFEYRLYGLVLEHCPNEHGFWLDADEDQRVLEFMQHRDASMQRKSSAEGEWSNWLNKLRKKR